MPQTKGIEDQAASRDALVLENLPLVALIVRRAASKLPPMVDVDDVEGAAVLGLIDAARKYDPSRGAKFRTYAAVRINGAIVDYLRSLTWAPRGMHRRAKEIEAARAAVEQRTGSRATVADIAEEMDLTLDQCHRLIAQVNTLDFQAADNHASEEDRAGRAATAGAGDPLSQLEWKAMVDIVQRAVEVLPERQKLVLWLYYYEELTMKEVGAVLQVNEARVSQLHSKAIAALRRGVDLHPSPRPSTSEG